jgi:trigger factor
VAEVLERNGNKVKFKVIIPAAEVNLAFTGVLNALSQQVRVPGFRPGKAPKGVLEKRVGKDYLVSEVREYLVGQAYPKAVKELELIPVSANVTPGDLAENAQFEFTVDAENYPEVTLPAWESLSIEAKPVEITDENVDQAIQELRERQASYDPVDREAQAEDLVTVEILEGEDAGQTYPVYLERSDANVRNALLGQSANAEAEVPMSGDNEDGQTLKVRIVDIKTKAVPALDDEFAKTMQLETLDELKAKVREDLEARAKQQTENNRKDEFVTKLAAGMTADVPQALVERRREALETDLTRDLERQGVTLESYKEYLKGENKLEEFDTDLDKSALDAVRRDLALEQLTEQQATQLTDEEWRNALENYARNNRVSVARLRELMGEEGLSNFKVVVTRDKTLDQIIAKLG